MLEPGSIEYEFISYDWLRLLAKNQVTAVDNSDLVCKHGNLDVNNTNAYKVISSESANFLYSKFGGGPRLSSASLCWTCVENKARKTKLRMEVVKDVKLLSVVAKQLIEA